MSASLKSGSIPFLLCLLACGQGKLGILLPVRERAQQDLPLGVDTDQAELLPAAIYYISDAEVELATHDDRVFFSC
jgi:hypothetical protein